MRKQAKDALRRKKPSTLIARGLGQFSTENRVLGAKNYPVYECLINSLWKEEGLAQILLSRQQQDGAFIFEVYVVDIFCLGLKNTFCNANFSSSRYEELKSRIFQDRKPVVCPVPLAHRIIHGAIEYASKLGFKPHRDFEISRNIIEEEKTGLGEGTDVQFGKDGKPLFIAGPDDNVDSIIKKLEVKLGAGNFNFLVPFAP